MEDLDCSYQVLKDSTDICRTVKEYCTENEVLNLFTLHYCNLDGNNFLFYFLVVNFNLKKILMVIIAFYLLGNVADTFLTPVLTKVSRALEMSETIAGVTLLAFANGAPDIIASMTAGDNEGGVFISVGGLFGACMFGATMVLGLCIIKSKHPVKVYI